MLGAADHGTRGQGRSRALTRNVRPGRRVSAHWELTAYGSDCDFPLTVTFRCTVVDHVEVARSWSTSAPWDVQYVLAQDDSRGDCSGRAPRATRTACAKP